MKKGSVLRPAACLLAAAGLAALFLVTQSRAPQEPAATSGEGPSLAQAAPDPSRRTVRIVPAAADPSSADPSAATGLVVRAVTVDGTPVPGVRVVAFRGDDSAADAEAPTGRDGVAQLAVAGGDWSLDARDAKWGAQTTKGHAPSASAVDLVVSAGEPLVLHVIDDEGRPVPGARICEFDRAVVVTRDDGTADLGVPRSTPWLRISAPGHAPWNGCVFPASPPCRVVLERGGVLIVRVRETDGRAAAAARVFVSRDHGEVDTVQTDDNGYARLDGWAAAGSVGLRVTSRSRRVAETSTVVPPAAASHEVDVVLPAGRVVAGIVVRAGSGTPIPGARVFASDDEAAWHELARTGADGRFRVEDVPGARGEELPLAVAAPGFSLAQGDDRSMTPIAGSDPDEAVVEMVENASLRGRVTDASGRPVAGARVVAMEQTSQPDRFEAVTGADGRFEIASMPPVDENLFIHHPDHPVFISYFETLAPGERRDAGDLAFPETFDWSADVVDEEGNPVPRANLQVMGAAERDAVNGSVFRDVIAGRFAAVRGVAEGARAEFRADGFVYAMIQVTKELHRVVLRRAVRAHGRLILASTGEPVGGAYLAMNALDGQLAWAFVTTAADGSFVATGLARARYRCIVEHANGGADAACETLVERDDQDLGTLRLE